ncbi:metalloprotease PmbA [Aliidiomarina taiwanensis]|uniref:Metalloprotease PmbA n=1 Tax=Aliidiomarina taiwanensis TaxID=946228 RepID=A0A432X7L1_9GAMM|nr:metalloprotease PmbA [Aliidiomarina taiwanensis]RUO42848.1 metalloprotease PmbA [Aliidiomarina taiwanensis]
MTSRKQLEQEVARAEEAVSNALAHAKRLGASAAECAINYSRGLSVSSRMNDIETVEFNQDGSLGISVYRGQHKGNASTADLSPEAVAATVEKACEIARYTEADPYTGLADAALMAQEPVDLELFYEADQTAEFASAQVLKCEEAMLSADPRIVNSDGANYATHCGFRMYGNTHGFLGHYLSSRNSLSCMPIAKDGDRMERDYAYTLARKFSDLTAPEQVAAEAVQNTVSRLGAQRLTTRKAPVIFHRDVAHGLFGHFVSAISGGNLYRKSSFLLDKLGQQVLPEWLNINEDPLIKGGLASSAFDHEGVATKPRSIVSGGVLETYLLTSYAARRLNSVATGHAGGIHNWLVEHGSDDLDALCKRMGTGLLVTELMGQGVNVVTGDYSRGAGGFWVENGEIQFPVTEVTIAGNLAHMLKSIVAIGNDVDMRHGVQTGSILLEEMKIAGE